MEDPRGAARYEEDSARGSIYPLQSLGPSSRPCILAKTPSTLNLERIRPQAGALGQATSENTPSRDCLESRYAGRIARFSVA
jgi:hypothetical protein